MQDWVEECSGLRYKRDVGDITEPQVVIYKIKNYKIDKERQYMFADFCYRINSFEVIAMIYEKFGPGFYYAEMQYELTPNKSDRSMQYKRIIKSKIFELMNDSKAPNLSYGRDIQDGN
jgi:hypothetical protein